MKTRKVLILESDRLIAEAIQEYLASNNYSCIWARSAAEAIALADKNSFACVVLELALGKNSGLEFIHEFRSYKDFNNVPIIVFTAQKVFDTVSLMNLGVAACLYKPQTSLQQLATKINEYTL